ncbi:MAG TPA: hypothetical protein VE860_05990 [Chthoniobacterales bacterium]|jgi:hypothetical protein|nr:hypothetical protein [Chthoniobacterales bacterium]
MKHIWVIGSCLIALTAFGDVVPKYPFPESESATYTQDQSPITDWIFEHWAAVGYAVPADGEHFVWRKYVVAVNDLSKLQAGDGIMYLNNDGITSTLALVVEVGLKEDAVAVMEPVPGGLVIMHGLDRSRIESAFRPVRKLSAKTL